MQNIVDSKNFFGLKKSFKIVSTLLENQNYQGAIPKYKLLEEDVILQEKYPKGLVAPPIFAPILLKLFNKKPFHIKWKKILEKIEKYHDFLITYRDPSQTGLISIYHPEESLQNQSTYFDIQKKEHDFSKHSLITTFEKYGYDQEILHHTTPFNVKSVLQNCLFAKSLEAEYVLNKKLYDLTKDQELLHKASIAKRRQIKTEHSIIENLWCKEDNCYYNYDVKRNTFIKTKDVNSIATVMLGKKDKNLAKTIALLRGREFQPKKGYGIVTTGLNTRKYKPNRLNKGPINPILNWYIIQGLKNFDIELAHNLKVQTTSIISEIFNKEDVITPAKSLLLTNNFTYPGSNIQLSNLNQKEVMDTTHNIFSILGWIAVIDKPRNDLWKLVKNKLEQNTPPKKIQNEFKTPLFYEGYLARETHEKETGTGLGEIGQTTTASVFLDLNQK